MKRMSYEEMIKTLVTLYKPTCIMVDGRIKGGYIDTDKPIENRAITEAIELAKATLYTDAHGWIPVSEQLPTEYGHYVCTYTVLVWGERKYLCRELTYEDGEWYFDENCLENICNAQGEILAWMPLPKLYRMEN